MCARWHTSSGRFVTANPPKRTRAAPPDSNGRSRRRRQRTISRKRRSSRNPLTTMSHSIAHQFEDYEQQQQTATLGMWVFLATEVVFFGGMFLGYMVYHSMYPAA